MWSRVGASVVVALSLLAAGCGSTRHLDADPSVQVAAATPPSPATWPSYPRFPAGSCWTRPFGGGRPLQAAPSYATALRRVEPAQLVRQILARFGDRRYVLRVELAPPPAITLQHLRGYFAGVRPPADALWAFVSAPTATQQPATPPAPGRVPEQMIAEWEAELVVGGLRDDFCAAGGAPLVGWTIGRGGIGLSDRTQALEQRFPNPSPAAFTLRAARIARRYGFRIQELRLLRPRQLAPLLVVRTDRDRKAFVHDIPAIMRLLDPTANGSRTTAVTFEGFFFEAVDARGPFAAVDDIYRGQTGGGQWSWSRCVYPYPHSEPFGAKPCP